MVGRPRPGRPRPRGCQSASRSASRRCRDVAQQLRVDQQLAPGFRRPRRAVVEQVEHPLAHHDVLPQRDGTVFVDDHRGVAAHRLDPAAELLGVAHRRRQAHQQHLIGQVQNHLLPHRAAHPVGQEMDLVHHDVGKPVQCRRIRIEHVSQHFGGHHHDVGIAVDRLVAGEQADLLWTVPAYQVVVLLVAQRLDRCGVEALSGPRPGPGARRTRPPPSCPRRSVHTPGRRARSPAPRTRAAGSRPTGTAAAR